MKVLVNEEINVNKWIECLENNLFSTPFQTVEFYNLFNDIEGYSALSVAIELDGKYLALAVVTIQKENGIKGYFSRRAIIYGGPLICHDNSEALETLLLEINNRLKGKIIYLESRNLADYSKFKLIFKKCGWNYQPYLNFHLNCSTREIVWNQLNNNRRRQISKAIKHEVIIKEAETLKEIENYYYLLKELYDKKIKKPLLPLAFFKKFYELKIGKYLLVYYKNKLIGGIMCPILPGKTIYEFYICGLDHEFREASPSVMATYAAIEYGYNNGLSRFDFMGAGKPTESYGVREFKEKFGGELVEYGRFIKINNLVLYKLGVIALKLIKKYNK